MSDVRWDTRLNGETNPADFISEDKNNALSLGKDNKLFISKNQAGGGGGYEPPDDGIPKKDLSAEVQGLLNKAQSALQSFTETDPVYKSEKSTLALKTDLTPLATTAALNAETQNRINADNALSGRIDEAKAIAQGRSRAKVFNNTAELDAWLAIQTNKDTLNIGDNFFLIATGEPDYWWDGTQKRALETEKVDLTQYYTKAQIDNLLSSKVDVTTFNTQLGLKVEQSDIDTSVQEHDADTTAHGIDEVKSDIETIKNDIEELQENGGGSNNGDSSVNWNSITGKPSTFPPSSHNHTVSDISDLDLNELATKDDIDQIANSLNLQTLMTTSYYSQDSEDKYLHEINVQKNNNGIYFTRADGQAFPSDIPLYFSFEVGDNNTWLLAGQIILLPSRIDALALNGKITLNATVPILFTNLDNNNKTLLNAKLIRESDTQFRLWVQYISSTVTNNYIDFDATSVGISWGR